jgi:hypothetical protein
VVAEQAAATVAGDLARADALAAERERVAEHFGELQAPVGGGAGTPSFRTALDDALAELAHQGAVDAALDARLGALREAVVRGAAWGAADAPTAPHSAPRSAPRALPPGAPAVPGATPDAADDAPSADAAPADPVHGVFGGALVAARAAGVGGALGGQYPGLLARDEYAPLPTPAPEAGVPRVDIRF